VKNQYKPTTRKVQGDEICTHNVYHSGDGGGGRSGTAKKVPSTAKQQQDPTSQEMKMQVFVQIKRQDYVH